MHAFKTTWGEMEDVSISSAEVLQKVQCLVSLKPCAAAMQRMLIVGSSYVSNVLLLSAACMVSVNLQPRQAGAH